MARGTGNESSSGKGAAARTATRKIAGMTDRPEGFDPERFYDDYGEKEWLRFGKRPCDRVSLEIHNDLLREFVRPGDRVLDAGAGPGRFTIELARLGALVVVGDISPEQLRLNEEKVVEAGLEPSVESRGLLDITDLSQFPDESFDAVVCYGGPLSYVFDHADTAAGELVRVLKPGGHLLISVMSKLGTYRMGLDEILGAADKVGQEVVDSVFQTGDLPPSLNNGHGMRMYTFQELKGVLERTGCNVVAASASNGLTVGAAELDTTDEARWEMLLRWERTACREPGALDSGTHIIAVAQRAS